MQVRYWEKHKVNWSAFEIFKGKLFMLRDKFVHPIYFSAISSENIHNALEHIRNYLNHSAVVISQRQMGVQTQISQIDKQLNSLESKIERRLNSVSKFTTELGRLEDANVSSKKMSKSLHDLANKLNEINQTLDDSERLPPFKFS